MIKNYVLRTYAPVRAVRYDGELESINSIKELTNMNVVTKRTFGDVASSLSTDANFNPALTFHIGDWIVVDKEMFIRIMDDINFDKTYVEMGSHDGTGVHSCTCMC